MFLPSDFKGVDVQREADDIVLSHTAYLKTKGKDTALALRRTKLDLHRELTDDEKTQHHTATGGLA